MPNFWHLAHQTPKYEPHEVFQIPKILAHHYSTISNMSRYRQQLKKFIYYFIYFISLSPYHRYLSLSVFSSLYSLFLFHNTLITKGHHSTLSIICLLYSASGSFFFSFFLFSFFFFFRSLFLAVV